eukprot:719460-Rhodomonas_salina.2
MTLLSTGHGITPAQAEDARYLPAEAPLHALTRKLRRQSVPRHHVGSPLLVAACRTSVPDMGMSSVRLYWAWLKPSHVRTGLVRLNPAESVPYMAVNACVRTGRGTAKAA